jgi:hypothetical protein
MWLSPSLHTTPAAGASTRYGLVSAVEVADAVDSAGAGDAGGVAVG